MPIGGKLVLKGGKSLGKLAGVEKKKSKKAKDPEAQLKAMGVELPEGAKVETEIDPGTGERKIKGAVKVLSADFTRSVYHWQ